jgi:hypothetical protein
MCELDCRGVEREFEYSKFCRFWFVQIFLSTVEIGFNHFTVIVSVDPATDELRQKQGFYRGNSTM